MLLNTNLRISYPARCPTLYLRATLVIQCKCDFSAEEIRRGKVLFERVLKIRLLKNCDASAVDGLI